MLQSSLMPALCSFPGQPVTPADRNPLSIPEHRNPLSIPECRYPLSIPEHRNPLSIPEHRNPLSIPEQSPCGLCSQASRAHKLEEISSLGGRNTSSPKLNNKNCGNAVSSHP
ncbi:hypothetical protein ACOMHN_042388 [Nucella lapillus]